MKQMTSSTPSTPTNASGPQELFLIEMNQVVKWKGLIVLIESHYPKGEGGRPAYTLCPSNAKLV